MKKLGLVISTIVFINFAASSFALSLASGVTTFGAISPITSPDEAKAFVKSAVSYALENMSPDMDYSKYVSQFFINDIDGNTFDFEEWVAHQKHIKEKVKSMRPTFDTMIAEGNNVFAIFRVNMVKKDGTELEVEDMAFFRIQDHKIIYVKELTRLLKGPAKEKNIGSRK